MAGGLFELLIGAAFVWLPGFGALIIAGPLAAAFLDGAERATSGAGVLGALADWGVSRQHLVGYEDEVKRGHTLLIAHGTPAQVAYAQTLLAGTDAAEVTRHGHSQPR